MSRSTGFFRRTRLVLAVATVWSTGAAISDVELLESIASLSSSSSVAAMPTTVPRSRCRLSRSQRSQRSIPLTARSTNASSRAEPKFVHCSSDGADGGRAGLQADSRHAMLRPGHRQFRESCSRARVVATHRTLGRSCERLIRGSTAPVSSNVQWGHPDECTS